MKNRKSSFLIPAFAGLLATAAMSSAGTLTITSGPTFQPDEAFTNRSIAATALHNPAGVNGDVVRVAGDSTIVPPSSGSAAITVTGTYSAQAGELVSGAYSFTVDSNVSTPVTYKLSGSITILGSPQNFSTSGTVNPGLNQYKGQFKAPANFPFATSGNFTGSLTFTFGSGSATASSAHPDGAAAAVAAGTLQASIQEVDFQLAPTQATPLPPSQPLNLSTRMLVETGDNVLIAGFIIPGNDPKKVIIRGLGPSLTTVSGTVLQNPTLQLNQGDTVLATNDDWKEHQTDVEATGIPPTKDAESAIVMTLAPGSYTAILAGKDGTSGVGVVEVYDLAQSADSRLANISTRGFVDTGDNVMIAGFILGPDSTSASTVIMRALGPSLGVGNALANPTLQLVDGNGNTITENDNWQDGPDKQRISDNNLAPSDPNESALLAIPAPGNYTAVVRGVDNGVGVGLVELYHLQ